MSRALPTCVVVSAVLVAVAVRSPAAPDRAATEPATKPAGRCMMWTAKSRTATVYLVGSLHEGRPGMYPLPKEMEDAFAKADLLVEEIIVPKDDDQVDQDDLIKRTQYAGDETLRDHLTPAQWDDVRKACDSTGLPVATAEKMKPEWLAYALEALAERKVTKAAKDRVVLPPGIDDYFAEAANKKKMPIEAFEIAQSQADRISGTPDKTAVKDLMDKVSAIRNAQVRTDGNHVRPDGNFAYWSIGDADAWGESVNKLAKRQPGWARHNLFDRNSRMADKIEQYLQGEKTVFVVVGCSHCVGDRGIVQMLRDDEVDVRQSPATKAESGGTPK